MLDFAAACLRPARAEMSAHEHVGWLQIAVFAATIGLLTRPLGGYLARVYGGERTLLRPLLGPLEQALYRFAGIKAEIEQNWFQYTSSFLDFHALAIAALYALLRLQSVLPLNPQNLPSVSRDLALNTALSFVTNTSWQSYAGETTLSYLSQMAGIRPRARCLFGFCSVLSSSPAA